jgi:hypothetical protein
MSTDVMTWTVDGTAVTAPAGLLPEGILGSPDAWHQRKLARARRFDYRQAGRMRDQARRDRQDAEL